MLFDTHAHLNDEKYDNDLNEVIDRSKEAGIKKIIVASYDLNSAYKAVNISRDREGIFCSLGIHPHQATDFNEKTLPELKNLIADNKKKVVAIGETGLDYHYDFSPRKKQIEVFREHIELSYRYDIPLIVHDRKAHDDCLKIVSDYHKEGKLSSRPGVFHCFSGDHNLALKLTDLGFYISFAGPLTFKNARHAPEVLRAIPEDKILIETDCPYLSPEPFRGKRNEPAYVSYIAEKMSDILGKPRDAVEKITYENACRLFAV